MEITVETVIQINTSTRPTVCDCFDGRSMTRSKCPACGGKGGTKGCLTWSRYVCDIPPRRPGR